jgi:zinc/manganese transport system substrate-binding protein
MSRRFAPRSWLAAVTVALVAALAGCASSTSQTHDVSGASGRQIRIVAATDVWGDIASQIGGRRASVTSIIDSPVADPHSYEADVQNQLAVSKADVVIENGGGYDDFLSTMVAVHGKRAKVLNAVDISGKKPDANGDLNEHVWYDFPTVAAVAINLRDHLVALDPTDAATFRANTQQLLGDLSGMERTEAAIAAAHRGQAVAITEPVPLYLLTACGLVNRTPPDFSRAIEEGRDVPPRALQQALDLFNSHQVRLLADNAQTVDPTTERVLAAAKADNIAVVPVTETLPAGQDYLTWMRSNLAAVQSALGNR